jgi:hypothetical protein
VLLDDIKAMRNSIRQFTTDVFSNSKNWKHIWTFIVNLDSSRTTVPPNNSLDEHLKRPSKRKNYEEPLREVSKRPRVFRKLTDATAIEALGNHHLPTPTSPGPQQDKRIHSVRSATPDSVLGEDNADDEKGSNSSHNLDVEVMRNTEPPYSPSSTTHQQRPTPITSQLPSVDAKPSFANITPIIPYQGGGAKALAERRRLARGQTQAEK